MVQNQANVWLTFGLTFIISLEHLSKLERGKRKPSIDLVVAIACYFHVSTDYLLTGKDHDMAENRTKLLDVVTQLTEIAKHM